MLKRKQLSISILACVVVALTASVAAAPAVAKHKKKTTVIGQVTHSNAGLSSTGIRVGSILSPAILQTKTVKAPKPGSITVNVTAAFENPGAPNSIYVSGVVECKKKKKDPITKYVIGGDYHKVPSPFSVKAPFPFGVPKPAACRLHVSSNVDPPPTADPFEPLPPATITITVLWRH
jgi:hypothetical protein